MMSMGDEVSGDVHRLQINVEEIKAAHQDVLEMYRKASNRIWYKIYGPNKE